MPGLSNILRDIRAAVVCILVSLAIVGSTGLGVAFADVGCRVDCCDHTPQVTHYAKSVTTDDCCPHHSKRGSIHAGDETVEHVAHHAEERSNDEHSDGDEHDCPDNCPSCNAGVSFALTMTPLLIPRAVVVTPEVTSFDVGEMPPSGTASGIYRPPRTLV